MNGLYGSDSFVLRQKLTRQNFVLELESASYSMTANQQIDKGFGARPFMPDLQSDVAGVRITPNKHYGGVTNPVCSIWNGSGGAANVELAWHRVGFA